MSLSSIEPRLNPTERCRREIDTSMAACVEPHKDYV